MSTVLHVSLWIYQLSQICIYLLIMYNYVSQNYLETFVFAILPSVSTSGLSVHLHSACPTFTRQSAGRISMKFHRSDQYHLYLCISSAHSTSLHKMATRAITRKILSGFHRTNCWWHFNETSWVICTIPSFAYPGMFCLGAQNGCKS
jgi:hypothetical protein